MNIWLAISLILAVISAYMFTIETYSVAFKLTGLATKKILNTVDRKKYDARVKAELKEQK